ncbi:MAG: hypothetical protein EBS55_09970 [Flavobacteriaceae bacterium]|nr:hypothetical protein [Flavobacteriaceae bacterium]
MEERYLKYVNEFNDGDFDSLLPFFNTMENILRFFHKKNLLQYVDPFDSNLEDYQNEILNFLINELGDKETIQKCISDLQDVEIREDGYYLVINDREDLADLYDDRGRNTTARDAARAVFADDSYEPYSDTTDDVYRDVIEELNPENIERLKSYMLEVLTNWKIEVDDYGSPELLIELSEEKGIFYLTPENVGQVISDEESMNYLMDQDYLDNLRSELYSIHYNAYNSAYETEVYNYVMSELETFFDVKTAKWESRPSQYNPEKLIEFYSLKFNPNEVVNSITKYISDRNLWGYYENNFGYQGSWLTMMYHLMDNGEEPWLDFRIPDYADSSLVDKYINEMFPDYI